MFTVYEKACLLALIQAEKESDAYQNRYTEKMREILNSAEEKLLPKSEQKEYEIEEDCAWDREYFEWVPTKWQCGCCHERVKKTDTVCWNCRSKLKPKEALIRINSSCDCATV